MVCVFTSFLLVVFIIAACRRKVNSFGRTFTICLQTCKIQQKSLTNRSKNVMEICVDKELPLCYYLAC